MMGPEEVARRVQDRCWPIIRDRNAPHEERVMAFLEMTATITTYCDHNKDYIDKSLREAILGDTDHDNPTPNDLMAGTDMLHLIADAMATGVALKEIKRAEREGHS